ncbi:MAG TPA: maleylpyruvate isomerase N-terminal domain-containing protein [Trebonia sp.]|nr:maleylpyruvate isomerase N-terminal domain-containing protein [Trebonia sp.]
MDAALRELSDEIDLATQRLLDEARTLTEDDLRGPSLLPGWSRAYVLAHVARGADVIRSLLAGARSGPDRPAYATAQEVQAATERAAAVPAKDLATDLADSAMALRTVVRQLPDEAWAVPVRVMGLAPFPAAALLTRRLTEVELHHGDLGTGYGPDDWSAAFAALELAEPMRTQRQDRVDRPAPEAATRSPARPVAPYRPGQPLPGSWIGPGRGGRRP